MANPEPSKFRVSIPEWMVRHWCVVCYLIINWNIRELVERVQVEPGERFYKVTAQLLHDYVHNNKMPPEEIAPTILNLAEDFMAGKPVKFRPGDYIAMQDYVRKSR